MTRYTLAAAAGYGGSFDAGTISYLLILVAGDVCALYQIIVFGLYFASRGKRPSTAIVTFLNNGFGKTVKLLFRERLSRRQRTIFSLVSWSLFLYLIVSLLAAQELFKNNETIFLKNGVVRRLYVNELPWVARSFADKRYERYLKEEPVRYFEFMSADNNSQKYLQNIYRIAKDLRDVGTKVVVADVPTGLEWSPRVRALISRIDSLDIVVWGGEWANSDIPYLIYPRNDSVSLDRSEYLNVYSVNSAKNNLPNPREYMEGKLFRWHPYMKPSLGSSAKDQIDVTVLVARKYFNLPDTAALRCTRDAVVIHDLIIPVTSSGEAYSDNSSRLFFPIVISASSGVGGGSAGFEFDPDSLRYNAQVETSKGVSLTSEKDTVKTLSPYREYFDGKVVVINWMYSAPTNFFDKLPVATLISNVLGKRLYSKIESLTYILSILTIAIIALLSAFSRSRYIVLASLLLAAGVYIFAAWIFLAHRILFDPLYPICAVGLSLVVFSLLKMAREAEQ
jgi:hypothetical protein